MTAQPHQIVQKLWNYCNLLRDDGLSYGDYVEQLTFLLFLKIAHDHPSLSILVVMRAVILELAGVPPD